ncbi:MAG: hypothetical protein EOM35_07450 [Negativicutes bacterium]|nr:hypothetical protein [Negativicutes bacterium]
MNKLVKTITPRELTKEFLLSLNGVLKLTDRELDVLSELVAIHLDNPNMSDIVCTAVRKHITNIKGVSKDNQSRYYSKFKTLGILRPAKRDGSFALSSAVIPEIIKDRVQIIIVLKIENNEDTDTSNTDDSRFDVSMARQESRTVEQVSQAA